MMPSDNLNSLKDDMIAFIEGHGMKRLPGFVMEDVASVLWEDEHNPDSWKDFVEMAKAAQAPFITMSDITLEKEDLQSLLGPEIPQQGRLVRIPPENLERVVELLRERGFAVE